MTDRLLDYLVRLKPTAYISEMSVKILFFLCVCFFGKLLLLFVIDRGVIFVADASRDGSGGTSGRLVTFLLYFFTASRIAVLII